MPWFEKFLLGGLSFVLLVSCTTVDVREGAAPGVRVPDIGIRYNSVGIIDKSLENWDGKVFDPPWSAFFSFGPFEHDKRSKIAVESTDSRRSPTGTLEIWVVLRNRTDFPLQIEGRSHFFDADKVPAENPSAWQRVILPPQGIATYKEYSTKDRNISYYYIEIREGR